MIDVRELRLGSYINTKQMNIFRVDEIRREDGLYMIRMYLDRLRGDSWIDVLPEHTQSIPLTEENLLKCGFEINSDDFGCKVATVKKYVPNISPISIVFDQYGNLVSTVVLGKTVTAYYLHLLQNLYFDITGEELEITHPIPGN